jgi:transposase-like protein
VELVGDLLGSAQGDVLRSALAPFLQPRRRWEDAFVHVVAEAYVAGVSTRRVEAVVEAMGAQGMSKSEVSRMASVLDAEVDAFRERRLEGELPYVWLDASCIEVRENHRTVSKAVLVPFGVSQDGQREVLGLAVTHGEMERCWRSFLEGLVERGPEGVQLVISDAHQGLRDAITAVRSGTTRQRCCVPTDSAVLRLVGMLLVEQHEAWTASDRRCVSAGDRKLLSTPTGDHELEDRHAVK